MISQEEANLLHPTKQIYVAAWWYKDKRAVLCEVTRVHKGNKGKNQWRLSHDPILDEDAITHVEVKPLEGNRHTRFLSVTEIIS